MACENRHRTEHRAFIGKTFQTESEYRKQLFVNNPKYGSTKIRKNFANERPLAENIFIKKRYQLLGLFYNEKLTQLHTLGLRKNTISGTTRASYTVLVR